ncbi:MAG TPA: hypothetical protein VII30_03680 [Gemmatimonadaceae bacterium]
MMIIIFGWGLIALLFLQPQAMVGRVAGWYWMLGLLCSAAILWAVVVIAVPMHARELDWDRWKEEFINISAPILALALTISVLAWLNAAPILRRIGRRGVGETPPSGRVPVRQSRRPFQLTTDDLVLWGRLASLIIMVLALFAFGLSYDKTLHRLDINWPELPAILVVFVLAELGVTLVTAAQQVSADVQESARAVDATSRAAGRANVKLRDAAAALKRVEDKTKTTVDALRPEISNLTREILNLTRLTKSDLWKFAPTTALQLSMNEDQLYAALNSFVNSWLPSNVDDESLPLLGTLFGAFVGNPESPGTVRKLKGVVSCIATDEVFAEASKQWLTRMSDGVQSGSELVVWAITTLLPSEFAFPTLYRGSSAQDEARVKALEDFIGSVIATCKTRNTLGEYKRVTILDKGEFDILTANKNTLGDDVTLKNWFVFDQRMPDTQIFKELGDIDRFHRVSIRVASSVEDVVHTGNALTKEEVEKVFPGEIVKDDRLKVFPFHTNSPGTLFDFRADVFAAGLYILGSNSLRWDQHLKPQTMRDAGVPDAHASAMDDWPRREIMKAIGWNCLLDWYVAGMHKARGGVQPAAWWSVVDDKHADLFNALSLHWGGTKIRTHDLLLLGTRPQFGDDEPTWHGAAISNLTADRTECTIQLVTDPSSLREIAHVVRQLCGGFKVPPDADELASCVMQYGKWSKWPEESWKRSERLPTEPSC